MDLCSSSGSMSAFYVGKTLFQSVFVLVPILLIFILSCEIFKYIMNYDNKEDFNKLLKRCCAKLIIAVLIFFVPSIIKSIYNSLDDGIFETTSFMDCYTTSSKESITYLRENEEAAKKQRQEEYEERQKEREEEHQDTIDKMKEAAENDNNTSTNSSVSNGNGLYYFDNMTSPDSKDDFNIIVAADSNYVGRKVTVTEEEKRWIITTIANEQGACKAESIATAQVIRDTYLYLGEYDTRFNTIDGVISNSFSTTYKTTYKTTEYAEYAFDYVFNQGNSFYPAKMFGQRSFDLSTYERDTLKYDILYTMKSHYDGSSSKTYITNSKYSTTYVIGNSKLETSSYINPNYKG